MLLQERGRRTRPVLQGEVGHEDDDADEGGADLGGGALQDVLAKAGGVGEQDLLTKPQTNLEKKNEGGELTEIFE